MRPRENSSQSRHVADAVRRSQNLMVGPNPVLAAAVAMIALSSAPVAPCPCLYRGSDRADEAGPFGFALKPKYKQSKKKMKWGNRAQATNLGRKDKACAQERYRYIREVEIELNSRTDEERTCQKLANLSASNCQIQRRQTQDDDRRH
jgi:hypothetical protein